MPSRKHSQEYFSTDSTARKQKVTRTAVEKWQDYLLARGLAPTTVKRHRESLSSFFTWCLSEGYIASNPVKSTAPPKDRRAHERMRQLPTPELDEVVTSVTAVSPVYADLVRVLAHTGLRYGGARRGRRWSATAPKYRCRCSR